MMDKCGYFHKYQAIREPTCGCEGCRRKWEVSKDIPLMFDSFSLQESEGGENLWWSFVGKECSFIIEHWNYKGADQSYIVIIRFTQDKGRYGFESDNWVGVLKWLKEKRLEYDKQIRM